MDEAVHGHVRQLLADLGYRSLDEIILEEFSHFSDHSEDLGRLHKAYQTAKRQKQLLDYDDLLVMLRQLLL
ncbi:MAG: hypothetical protein HC938_15955 [Nitrospira sp.]|nr:hypothetical protein [Nitrospira sp.]